MNNSQHSVTTDTLTGTITLTLRLEGYLTPSLNTILSSHWSKLHKHKQKAKLALISTFKELAPNSKISITSLAAQNASPINYDTLVSYMTMTQSPSAQATPNKSASTSKTKKQSSKSHTTPQPNQ
jgi:hypothetical protein